jgi:hypothetical protein
MLTPKSGTKPTKLGVSGQTGVLGQSDRSRLVAGPAKSHTSLIGGLDWFDQCLLESE